MNGIGELKILDAFSIFERQTFELQCAVRRIDPTGLKWRMHRGS
jgi:hypothetical protein